LAHPNVIWGPGMAWGGGLAQPCFVCFPFSHSDPFRSSITRSNGLCPLSSPDQTAQESHFHYINHGQGMHEIFPAVIMGRVELLNPLPSLKTTTLDQHEFDKEFGPPSSSVESASGSHQPSRGGCSRVKPEAPACHSSPWVLATTHLQPLVLYHMVP